MSRQLNIALVAVPSGTAVDVLNSGTFGSSVGFTAAPKIRVTGVSAANTDNTNNWDFQLFKGASGGSSNSAMILHSDVPAGSTTFFPLNSVFDMADFLTCIAPQSGANGKLVLNVAAEIYF